MRGAVRGGRRDRGIGGAGGVRWEGVEACSSVLSVWVVSFLWISFFSPRGGGGWL